MKKIFVSLFVFLLAIVVFPWTSSIAEDAPTLKTGAMELETNFNFGNTKPISRNIGFSLKYGIGKRIDFSFGIPLIIEKNSHLENLEFRLKYNLLHLANSFYMSFFLSWDISNGDYSTLFVFTKEFGNISLHINMGYDNIVDSKSFTSAIETELPIIDKVLIIIGINAIEEQTFNNTPDINSVFGCAYEINDFISIDTGIGIKLNDFEINNYNIGLTIEL